MAREFKPTNIPYVILGAGLLWFGWFGFNGGSALAANNLAVSAVVVTNLAAAAAAVSWMLMDWVIKGKPSAIGIAVGAVCGLAAITAASGYVSFMAAVIIGLVAGVVSNLVANWRAGRSRIDDTLDVFACHGIGGIIGAVAVGLFATALVNPSVNGLFYGHPATAWYPSSCSSGCFCLRICRFLFAFEIGGSVFASACESKRRRGWLRP